MSSSSSSSRFAAFLAQKREQLAATSPAAPTAEQQFRERCARYRAERLAPDIERIRSSSAGGGGGSPRPLRVALLFLVMDRPQDHEPLWRRWLRDASPDVVCADVFIHSKRCDGRRYRGSSSSFFHAHLARDFHRTPGWGTPELTETMLLLALEARRARGGGGYDHYVFLSEACIPTRPLEAFARELRASGGDSWLRRSAQAEDGYAQSGQFEPLAAWFPETCIRKSDQWVQLSATHLELLRALARFLREDAKEETDTPAEDAADARALLAPFAHVRASDEMFFATYLTLLEPAASGISERRMTTVCWLVGEAHPHTFTSIRAALRFAAEQPPPACMFVRKVCITAPRS